MYVWQMNDGSWNISILTGGRGIFDKIVKAGALHLYDRGYQTEAEARTAERTIRALIEAAA